MAYCKNCGAPMEEGTQVCPQCGTPQNQNQNNAPVEDSGSFLWGLLGFCLPIVGLILFLVWKDSKPRTAKVAGIGALVSVIIGVIFYVLMFIVGAGLAFMGA